MLILVADAFDAQFPQKMAAFGEVSDDLGRIGEAEVLIVRAKTKVTAELMDKAPKLRFVIRGGVGVDTIDVAYAKTKGILVKNTPKASGIAVAELAFALMLAVPNKLIEGHNGMLRGEFLKNELKRTELYGKTLCLMGAGNIAMEVARRAVAFGMTVLAFDPYKTEAAPATLVKDLKEAVAKADYISIHTPKTPETVGMVNADLFAAMKKGVVVINTGRGDVVNAKDMDAALTEGKVAAYATDVWPSDPPPPDYVLLKNPKVVMMPHLGASTKENLARIGNEVVELLTDYTKGRK
jgi:D-3-phosphoglycerate dehydrogenase